jgi:hypothetical protein
MLWVHNATNNNIAAFFQDKIVSIIGRILPGLSEAEC